MPRRPRIHLPGVPVHLVQRGHNREACFFTDEDYQAYRMWLDDALLKSGCALHAYVLMTNHVHLLLTPPSAEAVSQLVISPGRRYVQYINKTYRRTGTLWVADWRKKCWAGSHNGRIWRRLLRMRGHGSKSGRGGSNRCNAYQGWLPIESRNPAVLQNAR